MKQKVYVLDTNVLIKDPEAIHRLGDNIIVIPIIVIQELESFKNESELRGASARKALRIIDEYRSQGSLSTGVPTKTNGQLIVDCREIEWEELSGNLKKSNDLAILLVAKRYKKERSLFDIILLTEDIALRIMVASFGITVETYKNSENIKRIEELSLGTIDIDVPVSHDDYLNQLAHHGHLPIDIFSLPDGIYANQCCRLKKSDGKYCLAIYKPYRGHFVFVPKPETTRKCPGNIGPVNDEQAFAWALLRDKEIRIIALGGVAGGGKTLLSLATGNSQVGEGLYESMLVFRPTKQLGDDMGFLPGDLEEKFAPWQRPIIDNMKLIYNGREKLSKEGVRFSIVSELIRKGDLEIRPVNYEQGGTLRRTFTIVDESQNFGRETIKTLGTRNGEGSKMVFTGDLQQICGSAKLDPTSSGLAHLIEALKGEPVFAHITMIMSERDKLAELCANKL